MAEAYEGLIQYDPSAQNHASLAVVYADMGKIDQAVEQAKIAAQLEPGFEPEARQFVSELGRKW